MIIAIDNTHERNEQRILNNQAGNIDPELVRLNKLQTDTDVESKKGYFSLTM